MSIDPKPRWNFPPVVKGQMLQDPVQAEFFTAEDVGGIAQALMRETVQNALDARHRSEERVGVRFRLIDVAWERCSPYFHGLLPHLAAVFNEQGWELPEFDGDIKVLTIEDFGTKGLVGDVRISREDDARENNFFYFWRNIGRSNKSGDNRGRWGLGKTVFPAASKIKTFFGVTIRHNDLRRKLLMGQAVLRIHSFKSGSEDDQLTPYGH